MACVKKARGYIAFVLLLYTVTVTYFLARTAWGNGGLDPWVQGSQDGKDATFLSDLVREERRHLQNFQDVVHNYRGAGEDGSEQSSTEEDGETQGEVETEMTFNEGTQLNQTNGADLQMLPESSVGHGGAGGGRNVQVEVEEWDDGIVEKRRQEREHSVSLSNQRNSKKAGQPGDVNNMQDLQQLPMASGTRLDSPNSKKGDTTEYNTSYCSTIDHKESICQPERVTFKHPEHVPLAKSSMMFAQLGELLIYSAFLDPRQEPALVRLIALGPPHRTNQSNYWCVFDSPQLTSWEKQKDQVNPESHSLNQSAPSTQLNYYAASDGHNKSKQFYIMSCKVPPEFKHLRNRSELLEIRVVLGTQDSPLLDTVHEDMVLPVINNFASRKARWRTSSNKWKNVQMFNPAYSIPRQSQFDSDDEEINVADVNSVDYNAYKHRNLLQAESFVKENETKPNTANVGGSVMSMRVQKPMSGSKPILMQKDRLVSCVAPSQSPQAVLQIVEFLELTLLLGSQHVVLYTHPSLEDGVRSVLDMYQSQGLVTILPWNLPSGSDSVWARGRDLALNDCLYRTMFLYDFALFHDMDEFYVPRVTPDLPSFLSFLRHKGGLRQNKHTDLVFSSAYFPPPTKAQYKDLTNAPGFNKDVNKFSTLKSVRRSYISNKHPLRMINVTAAVRVGAGERQRTSLVVSNRLASVNHYSQCPRDSISANQINGQGEKVKGECDHTKVDYVMWRYKNILIQNTKDNVRALHKILRAKKHS